MAAQLRAISPDGAAAVLHLAGEGGALAEVPTAFDDFATGTLGKNAITVACLPETPTTNAFLWIVQSVLAAALVMAGLTPGIPPPRSAAPARLSIPLDAVPEGNAAIVLRYRRVRSAGRGSSGGRKSFALLPHGKHQMLLCETPDAGCSLPFGRCRGRHRPGCFP
ncbi:hypothetical protein [Actinoplanes sp. ATCC 53533]|uniref:hypothetical protein n=1 Tax=Actinoplanes sp. ATCC 53533 TaxID=1288362 RepID=UPI000F76D11F|nr:hypothetical protein [Actinoplanes sp. ATCC 53533]